MAKRIVRILIARGSISDSKDLLPLIAQAFPNDNLEISVTPKPKELKNQKKSIESAIKSYLKELNNTKIDFNNSIEEREELASKNKKLIEEIKREGVKISVSTILKSVLDSIL